MRTYNALIDAGTNALLAIDGSTAALTYLTECIPDSAYIKGVSFPGAYFVLKIFKRIDELPAWTWDKQRRRFVPTRRDILTSSILEKSRLARAKLDAINTMMTHLSAVRYKVFPGLVLQEFVYLTKRSQAQRFLDSDGDESTTLDVPYVVQYADLRGISTRQAAEDIVFKANMYDQILANTELLRLRYFGKVRSACTPEEMETILEEFTRDLYVNAQVA